MSAFKDLSGKQFGRLTVWRQAPRRIGKPIQWICECSCGTTDIVIWGGNLGRTPPHTESCGCLHKEVSQQTPLTHGMSDTSEWAIWTAIKQRCCNPRDRAYPHYGGRGITVCDEWRESFEAFLTDMGRRPGIAYTIERLYNDLGYSKDNCVWDTRTAQARNRRSNKLITLHGVTHCLTEWFHIKNISDGTYRSRRKLGWTIEEALLTPIGHVKNQPRKPNGQCQSVVRQSIA